MPRLILLVALLFVALLQAASGRPAGAAAASGVSGRAVSRVCGGAPTGEPGCPTPPVRATIVVLSLPSRHRVATMRADASGRFRVALAPGAYELRATAPGSLIYAPAQAVRVRLHRVTRVTITFVPRHPVPVAAGAR